MYLYFTALILCLISQYASQLKSKYWRIFVIIVIGLFLCFGYMCGSDWRGYEEMYYSLDIKNPFEIVKCEYGYYIYMFIFRLFSIDFWIFFILTKIILYIITINYILRYSYEKFFLTLSFFIAFFGLSLFIDNPMRTMIAGSIFLYAIEYIKKKDLKKYLLIVFFASFFHITILIMIPLFWLVKLKLKSWVIISTYILINITLWTFDETFRNIFLQQSGIPYIDSRLSFYFLDGSGGNIYAQNRNFSIGLLLRFLLFIILMFSKEKIVARHGHILFNLVVFGFFFHRLGISIPIFGRFLFYVCIPFCILMIDLKNSFTAKSQKFYLTFLIIIIFSTTYKFITFDYKYIPYSNYLQYIFNDKKPSFDERSMYNYRYSPYKDNNKNE